MATGVYTLGMGGYIFDPGGANQIVAEWKAAGFRAPPPFQQSNIQAVVSYIKLLPHDEQVFYAGDSCGANKAAWVAAAVYPRKIAGMYLIQPSYWCNAGEPAIPDNVEEVIVWYASWATTLGLGVYKPQLRVMPNVANVYDGNWHVGNNGKTRVRYIYRNWVHPDDNDPYIQGMILSQMKVDRAAAQKA